MFEKGLSDPTSQAASTSCMGRGEWKMFPSSSVTYRGTNFLFVKIFWSHLSVDTS